MRMIFRGHRFTRTFAHPFAARATHEAAVIEEELPPAQPGAATVAMAPQRQTVAEPGVRFPTSGLLCDVLSTACETAVQTP